MKQRVIELSYNNHQEAFVLPINPPQLDFMEAQNNQRINLLNIGEINLLGHRGLLSGSISSFFPSSKSPFFRYADREPMEYMRLLRKWKTAGQPIRVIISDCDVNLAMSIDSLQQSQREGDRDIYYSLELSEYPFLNVSTVQTPIQAVNSSNGLKIRPNTQPVPRTHTVVAGNSLWGISTKYYGSGAQYTKIYSANKTLIGANPNAIKVGQKLVIP